MSKPIKLPSRTFASKKECKDYCSNLLRSTPLKAKVNDIDCRILSELVSIYHPEPITKIGKGIDLIFVDYPKGWEGLKSKGFHIKRIDETIVDFSFHECLTSSKWKHFQQACRNTIESQIMKFKRSVNWELYKDYHVDHVYPFVRIIKDFCVEHKLDYCKIELIHVDNKFYFADRKIRNLFFSYHANHAQLQLLPAKENLSKGAKVS